MNAWRRIALATVALLTLGLLPAGVALAQVKVTAATPSSAYQGTVSLDVVVTGSGFDSSARVQYYVSGTINPGGVTVRRVVYRKSSELLTTIDVAPGAQLSGYDIEVTLSTGRKGKGTTLFSVKALPNTQEPLPTYPRERAWHAFSSGNTDGRLYMFGGAGSDWMVGPPYLWAYDVTVHAWNLVTPTGTSQPSGRQHLSFACGGDQCVMAMGSNGVSLVNETWLFDRGDNTWKMLSCGRRVTCPSARQMATLAYDESTGTYLLFGGSGSAGGLSDTFTLNTSVLAWTARSPVFRPSERNRAAALHVTGVGVLMHGGQPYRGNAALCDLYAWNGSNWAQITFDTSQPHPCLHSHSAAWDGQGVVIAGGYVDTSDTPNTAQWRFTFAPDGRSGQWSKLASPSCNAVLGVDAQIHPGARMARDAVSATQVWFGGEINTSEGVVRFDNTVECR